MSRPPRLLVLSWLALLALLGFTVLLAYQPLGAINVWVALGIAAVMALIVVAIFTELHEASALTIAVATAGLVWLGTLLWLSGTDYVTRPQFPPTAAVSGAS